ncbi:MAG TPA: heparin lyase I family protein [Burkholderiales bacterium]|nr:heparin lyase I family protein [Burkholderiales bacterium]
MDRRQESRSDSLRNSLCALFLVTLAACGGGGGGEPNQTSSQSLPSGSAGSTSSGSSQQARAAASAIDTGDILGEADANTPFAQQSGYNGQVIGQFPDAQDIPETGIHYSTLPNGETLRLGKVLDPWNPNLKVFAFQLGPNDPTTSGSKRSEFEFPPNVENGKTYWIAFSLNVQDWGSLPSGDDALFGTQVHSGDSSKGFSPSFSLVSYGSSGGRTFQVFRTSNTSGTSQTMVKYPEIPIRFGQWTEFVFKFRHATDNSGLLQVWMDGQQIVDYSGPIGFNTPGYRDYAKFGYYNWSSFNSSRKVLIRAPVLVQDPTGSKYTVDSLRAYVEAQ